MSKRRIGLVGAVAILLPAVALAFAWARHEYSAVIHRKPNLEHGAEIFGRCASCHGDTGRGTGDEKIPRIGGQHFQVLVKELVDYRGWQRYDERMEAVTDSHLLSDSQAIADVAGYVSQLQWPRFRQLFENAKEEPGGMLYAKRCQSCHGAAGQGDPVKLVPRLAGQHYKYLARQMVYASGARRSNITRRHSRLLASLKRDEILDVADFLSRSAWRDFEAPVDDGDKK